MPSVKVQMAQHAFSTWQTILEILLHPQFGIHLVSYSSVEFIQSCNGLLPLLDGFCYLNDVAVNIPITCILATCVEASIG